MNSFLGLYLMLTSSLVTHLGLFRFANRAQTLASIIYLVSLNGFIFYKET